jgi:hypothetical protein
MIAKTTIALLEDGDWAAELTAAELIRWDYEVLWITSSGLLSGDLDLSSVALIVTCKSRWEIERLLKPGVHPPVMTTNDFDLRLGGRILAYLDSAAAAGQQAAAALRPDQMHFRQAGSR